MNAILLSVAALLGLAVAIAMTMFCWRKIRRAKRTFTQALSLAGFLIGLYAIAVACVNCWAVLMLIQHGGAQ